MIKTFCSPQVMEDAQLQLEILLTNGLMDRAIDCLMFRWVSSREWVVHTVQWESVLQGQGDRPTNPLTVDWPNAEVRASKWKHSTPWLTNWVKLRQTELSQFQATNRHWHYRHFHFHKTRSQLHQKTANWPLNSFFSFPLFSNFRKHSFIEFPYLCVSDPAGRERYTTIPPKHRNKDILCTFFLGCSPIRLLSFPTVTATAGI